VRYFKNFDSFANWLVHKDMVESKFDVYTTKKDGLFKKIFQLLLIDFVFCYRLIPLFNFCFGCTTFSALGQRSWVAEARRKPKAKQVWVIYQ